MLLAISFSGLFKPISTVFKGLSSPKFASIIDKVVMPVAGVALSLKGAKSNQTLPAAPPVQPPSAAPNTNNAAGAGSAGNGGSAAGSGKPWYQNPAVYLGGAGVVLILAVVLMQGRR